MHKIFFSVCNWCAKVSFKKVLETLWLSFDTRATVYGPHTDTKVSPLSLDDMPKSGYLILAMRLRSACSLWVEGQWGALILLVQRGGALGDFACTLSCTVSWKRAAGHSTCKLSEESKSKAPAKTTGPHWGPQYSMVGLNVGKKSRRIQMDVLIIKLSFEWSDYFYFKKE